ncbi:ankyrin repeat domain-containing protein [Rhodoferax saidenbachensis]|uniref:Ankyrin repeat protein n=1 Tax=Rhodoferax saidenbachensis TaxID=1484693 RepID=A0ABU1ZI26_9BURK|nr:ankyrin repeat domain-containing protein [Rhodoferax saidenbachensis]MDR7305192.1 ankyrin repeat protein [Rhodoferax saidenbachensis]
MKYWFKLALYLFVFIGFSASKAGSYEDFFKAIARDDVDGITQLLARGFDPNTVNPKGVPGLLIALQEPSPKVAAVLLEHPDLEVEVRTAQDESPLMLAALRGYTELCAKLIERDADVNKPGWAPLHYAATNSHIAIMQLLLDNHAYIDAASPNGSTPLMMAAMYGNASAVKMLLEAGADPTLKNGIGLTAIDFANRVKKAESVEILAAFIRARRAKGSW